VPSSEGQQRIHCGLRQRFLKAKCVRVRPISWKIFWLRYKELVSWLVKFVSAPSPQQSSSSRHRKAVSVSTPSIDLGAFLTSSVRVHAPFLLPDVSGCRLSLPPDQWCSRRHLAQGNFLSHLQSTVDAILMIPNISWRVTSSMFMNKEGKITLSRGNYKDLDSRILSCFSLRCIILRNSSNYTYNVL
jgi:hypothetical protein